VNRQKCENLGGIEDATERYEIVIGVLEANMAGAVVDRLDTAGIKQSRVVRCG
jgi:hypothetical protein